MTKKPRTAKMGRPPLAPEKRRGASLSFRPRPEVRRQLEEAAQAHNRSVSQEVEARLEQSFSREAVGLEIFGDPETYSVMRTIGAVAAAVSEKAGKSWLDEVSSHQQVEKAAFLILRALRPVGGEGHAQSVLGLGRKQAARLLRQYAKEYEGDQPDDGEIERAYVAWVRSLLN